MPVATYYFDASDGGPTDPSAVWTNDANAFDGSTATEATTGTRSTVLNTNDLQGTGTNAPASGGTVLSVRARAYILTNAAPSTSAAVIYTSAYGELLGTVSGLTTDINAYTGYVTLSAPTGDWDWTKLGSLAVSLRKSQVVAGSLGFARVEIEVTYIDQGSANTAWLRA